MPLSESSLWLNIEQVLRDVHPDHGLEHAKRVYLHATKALLDGSCRELLSASQVAAVLVAAALHDVDDRKHGSFNNPQDFYARSILAVTIGNTTQLLFADTTNSAWVDLVCEMIHLVSAAHNGNDASVPEAQRWKLIPRWADRIEALGAEGVRRCWKVACRLGNPVFTDTTPLILDANRMARAELDASLVAYMVRGGTSASMMDHYTDKLLSLAHVPECTNTYLCQQLAREDAILRSVLNGLNLLRSNQQLSRNPACIESVLESLITSASTADIKKNENNVLREVIYCKVFFLSFAIRGGVVTKFDRWVFFWSRMRQDKRSLTVSQSLSLFAKIRYP